MPPRPSATIWFKQSKEAANNFAWVKNTQCKDKRSFGSLREAVDFAEHRDHRYFRSDLRRKGYHRSLTGPYLCPHCFRYHLGGNYRPQVAYRHLVLSIGTIPDQLGLPKALPYKKRAERVWATKTDATDDVVAQEMFRRSNFLVVNPAYVDISFTLYWIGSIITPSQDAYFYALHLALPHQIKGFLREKQGTDVPLSEIRTVRTCLT